MTRSIRSISCAALTIPLVASALAVAGCGSGTARSTTAFVAADPRSAPTPTEETINQIYRQDAVGVVDIKVRSRQRSVFGGSATAEDEGAGVVYDTSGDILTDEHVVTGATSIVVTFEDGHETAGRLVGTDPSTDVGVIRVDTPATTLRPLHFGDSTAEQVGNRLVAIGSPFGLPETVTSGIVSAVGRSITAPNGYTIAGAIQTDAPINPGNSGGPLIGDDGRVVGLADQIATDQTQSTGQPSSSGVGFATPSNLVSRVADEIIAGHRVEHAYLGVLLNPAAAGGAQVTAVEPGSPAARAGLRRGDLLTALNGHRVTSVPKLIEMIDTFAPGQTITVTLERGTKTISLRLTLGRQPRTQPNG